MSVPPTTPTGLSAVEEITEGGLTDSRTASTANRRTLSTIPPNNDELGLYLSCHRKNFDVTRDSKSVLNRLWSASNRFVPRLSIPLSVLASPLPVVEPRVGSSGKVLSAPHPRPKNKLRKKTRPSIAITLAVEPVSSFSLAQPPARSLEALQSGANLASVSPVAGFSSARSFFSFELPPVFSKARSKVLQRSKYRPSDGVGVTNGPSTSNRRDADSPRSRTRRHGEGKNGERVASLDDGVGAFPTSIRSAGDCDQGDSKEGTSPHRWSRLKSPWKLGLRLCGL